MGSDARRAARPARSLRGVRRRAVTCLLAALLAVPDWGWMTAISFNGAREPFVISEIFNGTKIGLTCRGLRSPTVIIIGEPLVATVIDEAVQSELAQSAQICILSVQDTAARYADPSLAEVLQSMLTNERVPGPYAIISYASESTVRAWITGPLVPQTAGYVLVDPTSASGNLVLTPDGDHWLLPTGATDETVLAILKLFWPPDEG